MGWRCQPCTVESRCRKRACPKRKSKSIPLWGSDSRVAFQKLRRRDERGIGQVRHWLGCYPLFHIFPQESGGCLFAAGDHRDFQDILDITLFEPYPINISRRPRVKYEIQPNQCNHRWCYSQIRSSIAWTTLSHLLCHYWMTSAETLLNTHTVCMPWNIMKHWDLNIPWTWFLCNDQVNQEKSR